MKKQIITMVALTMLSAATAMAQGERPEQKGPRGNMMEKMKTELSLTDEQAAKMQEVFKEMRPSKQGERPSREEMEKKRTEMETKIKGILTEEQYAKYQKMRSERRPPRHEKKTENGD